uniref:Calmodulin-lysine N-methyltransferase n=1 Tax=Caenorhabditis tropicalis TaxID=1561998 RepID=A0A1I7UUG8_9PELO
MLGEQTDGKPSGSRKKKEAEEERTGRDEGDFVDEKIHQKLSSCPSFGSIDSTPFSSAPSSAPSSTSSTRARRNWSVFSERLRETLCKSRKSSTADSLILFDVKYVETKNSMRNDIECMWIYQRDNSSFDSDYDDYDDSHLRIFKFFPPKTAISLHSLASGFDNTGNVRIWPGSEALAWMIRKDPSSILAPGNRILELGAGFLGLSSFLICKLFPDSSVWVTDGNLESIKSLEQIKNANPDLRNRVHVQQLIWGQHQLNTQRFNTILAADCVFFAECHESLMKCIHSHLAFDGSAVISSPRRKQSLQKFLDYVATVWHNEFTIENDEMINLILEQKIGGIWSTEEEKDEKFPELKGALQLGVLKTADSIGERVGERNGMDMQFNEEVISQVAAFVWDTVATDWADDLSRFTAHAGRQKVNMDDIALLTRRNPDLLQAACKMANVEYQEAGQKTSKSRKRKKDDAAPMQPAKPIEEEEEEITILDDKILQTPKPCLKKGKFQAEEQFRNRATSTPKTAERSLRFPNEITPIRPTDNNQSFSSNHVNLSAIEEERTIDKEEVEDQDSFDIFGETQKNDSTKTITNSSSVLKQAEEYHSSIVEPTINRLENERLERMVPPEEIETVSIDSFDDFNIEEVQQIDKSHGTPKNAVFSKKMSSFAFDDEDSFDDPVVQDVNKTPKSSTSTKQKEKSTISTPKSVSKSKRSTTLQLDHDSFDEFDFDI